MEEETTNVEVVETQNDSENLDLGKFNQTQVNKIVSERLTRQKKENDRVLQQVNADLEAQTALVAEYEAKLAELIAKQMGDLPEAMKELIEKLSISEQLEWLSKHGQSSEIKGFEKQTIPATPKGSDGEKKFKPNLRNTFKI